MLVNFALWHASGTVMFPILTIEVTCIWSNWAKIKEVLSYHIM